jgi:biotin carboxyl carrier protein
MKRELSLTVDGVEYPVVAEGNTITVNGRLFTVEVDDDGAVLVDGIAYDVALDGETATLGGQSLSLRVSGLGVAAATSAPATPSGPMARRPAQADVGAVLAIMPGKIVRVLVEAGQEVQEGDPLCVLEAMKMESELHAHQDGTVRQVHVRPGDDVERDQVLLEIE